MHDANKTTALRHAINRKKFQNSFNESWPINESEKESFALEISNILSEGGFCDKEIEQINSGNVELKDCLYENLLEEILEKSGVTDVDEQLKEGLKFYVEAIHDRYADAIKETSQGEFAGDKFNGAILENLQKFLNKNEMNSLCNDIDSYCFESAQLIDKGWSEFQEVLQGLKYQEVEIEGSQIVERGNESSRHSEGRVAKLAAFFEDAANGGGALDELKSVKDMLQGEVSPEDGTQSDPSHLSTQQDSSKGRS